MKRIFPADKLRPQTLPHRQKRDRRPCNSRGTQDTYFSLSPPPPPTRAIGQWTRSLEWRHAVTLHILVGKICITFFLFYCEDMLSLVALWVLWLCVASRHDWLDSQRWYFSHPPSQLVVFRSDASFASEGTWRPPNFGANYSTLWVFARDGFSRWKGAHRFWRRQHGQCKENLLTLVKRIRWITLVIMLNIR